jgi:hypothetical protein
MPSITTNIAIAASPSIVRKVILDFPSYPAWNPFITSAQVSDPAAAPGTPIKLVIWKFITQKSTIVQNNGSEFSWVGIIFGKWFFQADHRLEFASLGDALAENGETLNCKVVQSERLSGVLAILSFIYGPLMKKGFEKMNEALKVKAEASASASRG